MNADRPFLQLEGLGKRYGAIAVLTDVSADIGSDEFVCLLGPSGCGKTTLLRILCGIDRADAGRVRLHGEDITGMPPAARGFGIVFQSYALFPNLTAAENVAYGLRGLDRERARRRAGEMLDLVGLAAHADKHPAQLSGGQQQRVALARALAPQPRLLLLDEPLSALDAQVRATLREELRRLQRTLRVPTVMVTHDQDEALAIADRVLLMNAGRIVQDASPHRLYAQPVDTFAAGFVGRMNLWPAQWTGEAWRIGALSLSGPPPAPGSGIHHMLGLRPEALQVLPPGTPTPPGTDGLAGFVEELVFCGAYLVLRLRVPALGEPVEAVLPTPPGPRLPWRSGEPVRLALPAGALVVMPPGREGRWAPAAAQAAAA